jgi:Leucine-rich repeat (LRR) protein
MKKNYLMYAPLMLIFASCGGSSESTESTETPKDSVVAEIEYAPLKTQEEFQAETVYSTMADFNAVADKSTVIRFVSNEYNQPFPTEILEAHNLHVLSLNMMTGEIPAEISKLKNLTNLCINGDQLTTLPESLSECQNLRVVSLSGCKSLDLAQAIDVLKKCPGIQYLDISYMGLTEVPASISELAGLTHVRLGNNPITALPESFYGMQNLEEIRVGSNEGFNYADFLTKAKAFPALKTLWLQYCNLASLPAVLNEYPVLEMVRWAEEWEGKSSDQIIATTEKENKKFPKLTISWNNMSGMLYDVY